MAEANIYSRTRSFQTHRKFGPLKVRAELETSNFIRGFCDAGTSPTSLRIVRLKLNHKFAPTRLLAADHC